MEEPLVSIIIPYFNSADALRKNLPYLLENLKNTAWKWELIVVNDGSRDANQITQIIANSPARLLSYTDNMGKGEALRKGFYAANGSVQVFTDPDIPYEFEAITKIVELISNNTADLVIGNRLLKDSIYYDKVSWIRKWGSRFISVFLGRLVTGGFYDTQCGIKGFSREAGKKIFEWSSVKRFAIDIQIIYLALKFHFRIIKIPVKLRSTDGKTVKVFRDGFTMIGDIFRIKFNYMKKKRAHEKKR